MKVKFKCSCVGINPGDYTNQIWVHAPAHMKNENGYCLDRCVAEEVMQLWILGIKTTGCCCGHGKDNSYIGVVDEDIEKMRIMGYKNRHNKCRPNDKDSFIPMGHKNLSRVYGGKDGVFVLQAEEENGNWKDYLKYNPSKIGPIEEHPSKRIVYYPNLTNKNIPYSISASSYKDKLEELNGGPPIVDSREVVEFKNTLKV